jgi:hypothetical protein
VSANDISKDIGPVVNRIYQSQRNGKFDLPASLLPENATRFGPIESFRIQSNSPLSECDPLPVQITLASGESFCNIHYIILCTGYLFSLPFLKAYHNDTLTPQDANDKVLVTDGHQIHNLHKDIFYIPDPSLIFVGVPFFTATFSLFDFQAIVVAKYLAARVQLPSLEEQRIEYRNRVDQKGYGKPFHSLRDKEEEYVDDLLQWINKPIVEAGGQPIRGHSEEWLQAKTEQRERIKLLFGDAGTDSGILGGNLVELRGCN